MSSDFLMWMIIALVVWIGINVGLAFVVANMAKQKGYSYGGFWCLSFFLSFIVGLIVVLCIDDKNARPYAPYQVPPAGPGAQPGIWYCSYCGTSMREGDRFCPGCGQKIG